MKNQLPFLKILIVQRLLHSVYIMTEPLVINPGKSVCPHSDTIETNRLVCASL